MEYIYIYFHKSWTAIYKIIEQIDKYAKMISRYTMISRYSYIIDIATEHKAWLVIKFALDVSILNAREGGHWLRSLHTNSSTGGCCMHAKDPGTRHLAIPEQN